MKILIITDTYIGQPGGSERHLYNFVTATDGQQDIIVFQLNPDGNPGFPDGPLSGFENCCLRSHPLEKIASFSTVRVMVELMRTIKQEKINIVASYHEKSDLINYLLRFIPGLRIKHFSSKRDLGFKQSKNLRKIMRFISPSFDGVYAPSESITTQMVREFNVSAEKTVTIYNGASLEQLAPLESGEKEKAKTNLGLSVEKNYFICVGWLKPVKGHRALLEAFSEVAVANPKWDLLLAGVGELESSLKESCRTLGIEDRVHFLGFRKDVSELLQCSDVIVNSSESEGLSNALVEGISTALPGVATDVGGNSEIIRHQENGFIVPLGDVKSLASALSRLATDQELRGRMSEQSRVLAEAHFCKEQMAAKMLKMFSSAYGGVSL